MINTPYFSKMDDVIHFEKPADLESIQANGRLYLKSIMKYTYIVFIKDIIQYNHLEFSIGQKLVYDTESVKINKIANKKNTHIIKTLIDENNKIIKCINDIETTLENIFKIIQSEYNKDNMCKYIKYLYNLILYEYYLKKSFRIIEDKLIEFLSLLKNDNKDTYVNIFNEISSYSDFFNENFNNIKQQKEYTIEMLDMFFIKTCIHISSMSSSNKSIVKDTMSNIIKKNTRFINSLLDTKYIVFLKLFMDEKEINFIKRIAYISLREGTAYDNNHVMKFLFNQEIQKEICSYL